MTPSEFYTSQFYSWEYRGRGWFVADGPVHLEPPFIPYFRHGYPKDYVDDGKRHTLVSSFFESLKPEKKPIQYNQILLEYASIEPYLYEESPTLVALQVKFPKDRKITPEKMKTLLVMVSHLSTPVSFEIIGTATETSVQFVCSEELSDTIETYVNALFPSFSVLRIDTYLDGIF